MTAPNDRPWQAIRADFPALCGGVTVHGRPLVYLDSASTAQKPQAVLDALLGVYVRGCANIHRGVHTLSQQATDQYEAVREKVRRFLRAPAAAEVIFTRGTTEAINLLAGTLGRANVTAGDEVLVSGLEHHSNLVPWQRLCADVRAQLRVLPLDANGAVDLNRAAGCFSERTRIMSISHASNALGCVLPLRELIALARRHAPRALIVIDGAQAVPHLPVDVGALDCDFYCFSAHKAYGPTGAGALWGRAALLDALPPWQSGGDMVLSVSLQQTLYQAPPQRFEAGTPPIADVIAMGAALDYLSSLDIGRLAAEEADLRRYGVDRLSRIEGVRVLGGAGSASADADGVTHVPVISFLVDGIHPHDVGTALDFEGVAVRTGHHCAQPLMQHLGITGTVRASLGCYSSRADLDALASALDAVQRMFRTAAAPVG